MKNDIVAPPNQTSLNQPQSPPKPDISPAKPKLPAAQPASAAAEKTQPVRHENSPTLMIVLSVLTCLALAAVAIIRELKNVN